MYVSYSSFLDTGSIRNLGCLRLVIQQESDDTSTSTRSLTARSAGSQGSRFNRRGSPSPDTDLPTSADTSTAATPVGSSTPTGAVLVPGRDRSGTVIGRRVWDEPAPRPRLRPHQRRASPPDSASPPPSTDTSRPETETEDDDVDMDRGERHDIDDTSPSPEPRHDRRLLLQRPRRTVAIVSDVPVALPLPGNTDAHIIIGDGGGMGRAGDMQVEDGIVLLEQNDDFAMGAPPGAPGAITIQDGATPRNMDIRVVVGGGDPDRTRHRAALDVTPRAGVTNLPPAVISAGEVGGVTVHRGGTIRGVRLPNDAPNGIPPGNATQGGVLGRSPGLGLTMNRTSSAHHRAGMDMGTAAPYRDEDVLLSLQLLAYLSKYPHVRQAFYKPRVAFHPATIQLGARGGPSSATAGKGAPGRTGISGGGGGTSRGHFPGSTMLGREPHNFLRAFTSAASRGKEKEKHPFGFISASSSSASGSSSSTTSAPTPAPAPVPTRQTNVFSLVERFTFRPSSSEADLPNPPPKLPAEIQYWAGVIMRNACRKDESRGGIRQCANST